MEMNESVGECNLHFWLNKHRGLIEENEQQWTGTRVFCALPFILSYESCRSFSNNSSLSLTDDSSFSKNRRRICG